MKPSIRHAIFDPDQNMFLAEGSSWNNFVWTDKVGNIKSYVAYEDMLKSLQNVSDKHPSAYIAEIELSVAWKRVNIPIEVRFAKEIALYNVLLPQFEADADKMREKDWLLFRSVHNKLREVGYPVCGGLGPVPIKIEW